MGSPAAKFKGGGGGQNIKRGTSCDSVTIRCLAGGCSMKSSLKIAGVACGLALMAEGALAGPQLKLNSLGYFEAPGLNVTVFADIYPDGHQTGVTVIQHGVRVAANGDLRLEPSPGQWSPMPAGGAQTVDAAANTVTQTLSFPDP